jgi:hypothetical protein
LKPINPVSNVMKDSKLNKTKLMILFNSYLKNSTNFPRFFDGKESSKKINSDEATSNDVAISDEILSDCSDTEDITIVNINPLNLGF